jgi:Ran GTPase-activating protein (RanGAP) involved in mRNA processing and transport
MNEINRLYNEYEIKQLTISEIAMIHKRTELAILHKLEKENIIDSSWNDARGWKLSDNSNFKNYLEKIKHNYEGEEDEELDDEEDEELDDEEDEELDDDDDDDEDYIDEPSSDEEELDNRNTSRITTFLELVNYIKEYFPSNVKKSDHFTSSNAV